MKSIMYYINDMKNEEKSKDINNLFYIFEKLKSCNDIIEMANFLADWIIKKYEVHCISIIMSNLRKNKNITLVQKAKKYNLNDKHVTNFIINTHSDTNVIISFKSQNEKHFQKLNKRKSYFYAIFSLISPLIENSILKKSYIELNSIDSITNTYTRNHFLNHIENKLKYADETMDKITFLMIGVDRFKAVIDEYDYKIGDKVLIELVKVIYSCINSNDMVGRLNNDEFLVALPDKDSTDEYVLTIVRDIIRKFSQKKIIVNEKTKYFLKKTICIGISSYPKDSNNINQVIKNADNFLYEAKNKGRSQFMIFNKEKESSVTLF